MVNKEKLKRADWLECSNCGSYITSKDSQVHNRVCQQEQDEQTEDKHGFIHDAVFFGICIKNTRDVFLPRSLHWIIVSPSAMQLCSMELCSTVLVTNENGVETPCEVWPSKALAKTHLLVSPAVSDTLGGVADGSLLSVRSFEESVLPATRIELTSIEPYSYEKLQEYLSRHLLEQIVCQGMPLSLTYFGAKVEFVATSVTYDEETELAESFQSLNLQYTSTPVKAVSPATPKRQLSEIPENYLCKRYRKRFLEMASSRRYCIISEETDIQLNTENIEEEAPIERKISWEDIGGLDEEVKKITDVLNILFSNSTRSVDLPRGILLCGPHGTGKTMISHALLNQYSDRVFFIRGPEIFSKFYGETEERIRSYFEKASKRAPCVIFIDEAETLCGKRGSGNRSQQEERVTATILTQLDHLKKGVLVMVASSKPDALEPALRRAGRLDWEIELPVPSPKQRNSILTKLLNNVQHSLTKDQIANISEKAHGFVGSDLSQLRVEAGLHALRESRTCICLDDLHVALAQVKPSAVREILLEVPKVLWTDIAGQDSVKLALQQAVSWPLSHPEAFVRMGISPPKGVLLYGPPGCSKTMIAKALATESRVNFIAVKGPELFNKWVGESERAVREIFRKARQASPSIIFFDELDALASSRSSGQTGVQERVLAQILTEIDGIQGLKDVTIVAATNRPDLIDKALLRPGRLDRIIYVPLPDETTRCEIFKLQFRTIPVSDDVCAEQLAKNTDGYSGAEVVGICQEAALDALQESIEAKQVGLTNMMKALDKIKPRTDPNMICFYEQYSKEITK